MAKSLWARTLDQLSRCDVTGVGQVDHLDCSEAYPPDEVTVQCETVDEVKAGARLIEQERCIRELQAELRLQVALLPRYRDEYRAYYRSEQIEKSPSTGFTKDDQGKPRVDLTPTGFLLEMGRVFAHGASKYGVDNWQKCEDPRRYEAAAMRHLLAYIDGERQDPESGYSHLAHCACSLAMRFGLKVQP